ncbi:MAG: PAS domain S-box protein [Deltaproteobacteria bacterium]|nr:PAS domain S-box protein [Deltaproteobacteria bacterium]
MDDIAGDKSARSIEHQQLTDRIHELEKVKQDFERQSFEYNSLLERSPDPIVIYDESGQARYINPAFTTEFGFTRNDVLGKRIPFVPDEEKERTAWIIHEIIKGRQLSGFETKRLTKDGRKIDVSLSTYRYYSPEGGFAGTIVISRDITEHKKMEKELRNEIAKRKQVEAELRTAHDELKTLLDDRTARIMKASELMKRSAERLKKGLE